MRRVAPTLAILALAGCVLGSGETSRVERVPEELRRPHVVAPRIPDRYAFGDVSRLHPGEWATYREGDRTFTLADVGASGEDAWIEVIEETEPRQVSARLVGRDRVVKKAYYGELSKDGRWSAIEPQSLDQSALPPARRANEMSRETGIEKVVVGGRELQVRRVAIRLEDLEGRLTREVSLWSKEVPPVFSGTDDGGLVRRQSEESTLELTAFGFDARPLLDHPR